jgi:hypothetical protein
MKLLAIKEMQAFIKSLFEFLCFKVNKADMTNATTLLDRISIEYITQKGL